MGKKEELNDFEHDVTVCAEWASLSRLRTTVTLFTLNYLSGSQREV